MTSTITHVRLSDVTPNRGTVQKLYTIKEWAAADARGARLYSLDPLNGDVPEIGERVFVGECSVIGRAPGKAVK